MSGDNVHIILPDATIQKIKALFEIDFPEAYAACTSRDPNERVPALAMYNAYKMGCLRGGQIK
jgi:hypothetical protein